MKPTVRIDDVLCGSNDWKGRRDPTHRFNQVCRWLYQIDLEFIPTILCQDLMQFPEALQKIREDTKEGKMTPALHGWEHTDYGSFSEDKLRDHLERSMGWFKEELEYTPTMWATPWGAESARLTKVAKEFNLSVEGTGGWPEPGHWLHLAKSTDFNLLPKRIMWHWWERGQKMLKVIEVIKYESYNNAVVIRPDLFK